MTILSHPRLACLAAAAWLGFAHPAIAAEPVKEAGREGRQEAGRQEAGLPAAPALTPLQRSIATLKKAAEARPDDATLQYYLALYSARAGDKEAALAGLRRVLETGRGFLPPPDAGFTRLERDPDYQALHAQLAKRQPVVADAPVAFRIHDREFAPEGIAYDPQDDCFYVGSVARHRIVRIARDGTVTDFSLPGDGLQSVLGIAVDARRRLLYAVSTSGFTADGRAHLVNDVVRYDLRSGKRKDAFAVPAAQHLNDVAIAPDGSVYASDSRAGAVFRVFEGGSGDRPFVPAGLMRGTNGLAVSADGRRLYAAHAMGIARIDLPGGAVHDMPNPPADNVGTVDGMTLHGNELLGIQNGTNPGRVIRMTLDRAGERIVAVETLQSHHNPAFDEPTAGAVAGDAYYVLATTQLGRYNARGGFDDPATLKEPLVVRIPLTDR